MAIIVKPFTFSAGATIIASEHNSNFDTLYSDYDGNITNANLSNSAAVAYSKLSLTGSILDADISNSANISSSKLAIITSGSRVSGSALTALTTIPVGAGVIPILNLVTSGTSNSTTFFRGDSTLVSLSSIVSRTTLNSGISMALTGAARYTTFGAATTSTTSGAVISNVPYTGIAKNFYVNLDSVPGGAQTAIFTLRKNGADTNIVATVLTSGTSANDTTHTVVYNAGDTMDFYGVYNGTITRIVNATLEYDG